MMKPLELVLAELATSFLEEPGESRAVEIRQADLSVPLEIHWGGRGVLAASLPRWRLATGFEPVLHRLRVKVGDAAGEES